jgi:hypothetical protein
MVSGSRVVLVLSLVMLGLLTAVPTGGAVSGHPPTATDGPAGQPQTGDTAETQTFVVDLRQNGDARWTVSKTFTLTSENETAAFESLAEEFEAGETSDLGLRSYEPASQLAADSTGREMQITNVSRSATRTGTATNGTGTLSISFTWTAFGRLDGDRLYIDDVFTTGGETWFDGLYADQRLVIEPPDGYNVFDAAAPVQSGAIQWTGPEEFTAERLSATFEQTGNGGPTVTPTPPGTTEPAPTTATTGTPDEDTESGSLLWVGLVTLGIGAVVVGYLLARDRDLLDSLRKDRSGSAPPAEPDSGPDRPPGPATETARTGATGESAEVSRDGSKNGIDAELLSDEERVERLLEQNGGRMKQANIVKETNWSNAKVSQLLSSMEEEGQIDKLRIGRENLISFPDEDVTDLEE